MSFSVKYKSPECKPRVAHLQLTEQYRVLLDVSYPNGHTLVHELGSNEQLLPKFQKMFVLKSSNQSIYEGVGNALKCKTAKS